MGTIYFHGNHFCALTEEEWKMNFGKGVLHDYTRKGNSGLFVFLFFFGRNFDIKWPKKNL